jgi:hypothetical protein
MPNAQLNQLGIVLTFVASVAITPELLGAKRWKAIQSRWSERALLVEQSLARRRQVSNPRHPGVVGALDAFGDATSTALSAYLLAAIVVTVSLGFVVALSVGVAVLIVWLVVLIILGTLIELSDLLPLRVEIGKRRFLPRLLASPATGTTFFMSWWLPALWSFALAVQVVALTRTAQAAELIARNLGAPGGIASLLLPIGSLLLSAGFLMQFLATL